MIAILREFSTSLQNTSQKNQVAFFRAFLAAHSSLQNPQAQAQAVTELNTQVSQILGGNNHQAINTTEALLHLANLQNQDTANSIALGDVGALACASSSRIINRDIARLLNDYFQTPQQQALQSFTAIIDHLINNQVAMQDDLMTAGQVVNSALAPASAQSTAQSSCAAAAPETAQSSCAAAETAQSSCAAAAPETPRNSQPSIPSNPPALPQNVPVQLPPLPPAMHDALEQLIQQQLPPLFLISANSLDDNRSRDSIER
jgi:hypothetical protein